MSYIEKKNKTIKSLDEIGLGGLFREIQGIDNGAVLRADQNMSTGTCTILLQLDNRMWNTISFGLGKLSNVLKKDNLLSLLNSFNNQSALIKFFIDESNYIIAEVLYIADDKSFDANEYTGLIGPVFKILEDNFYSKIMKVMWS